MSKMFKKEVKGRFQNSFSGFLRAGLVMLLVILQVALIFFSSYLLREYSVYIYTIIQVVGLIIIILLINDDRSASYKFGWLFIILALPVTGHIMFLLWGNSKFKHKLNKDAMDQLNRGLDHIEHDREVEELFNECYPTKERMSRYIKSHGFGLFKNNDIEYYPMGEDVFEAIFKEMKAAEKYILIKFFIVGEGLLWDRMHELLLKKIKQGVKVKFFYDDFGAMFRTNKNFKRDLEDEGFEVQVFNPIHRYTEKLFMNYRTHQKIIVVDGNVGFTGGINLADEYVNIIDRFGVWKDNAVKIRGDAVWGLTVTFLQMWEVTTGKNTINYDEFRPTEKFEENNVFCQIISDGPANNPANPIESVYKQHINTAKKFLYITTPYLILEDDMRHSLEVAAKSGVDVRIMTPSIPDKKNVKRLTEYNYGPLLKAGVRIFEYTPGFMHAKTIINEESGIVGTINMDYRSFYLHYECGALIYNDKFIKDVKKDLDETIEISEEIFYEDWINRPFYKKVYQLMLNLFATQL